VGDIPYYRREAGRAVIAAGALERFGSTALLRSVVVADSQRSRGLGRQLIAELERWSAGQGIRQLVLLTQTAEAFFRALGYRVIERSGAPAAVQQSAEFRSLCPSSATCMVKDLAGDR
jgi:amino-acid N-acetyltransferase